MSSRTTAGVLTRRPGALQTLAASLERYDVAAPNAPNFAAILLLFFCWHLIWRIWKGGAIPRGFKSFAIIDSL